MAKEEEVSVCWDPGPALQSPLPSTLGSRLSLRVELGASPFVWPRLPGPAHGPAPLKTPQPWGPRFARSAGPGAPPQPLASDGPLWLTRQQLFCHETPREQGLCDAGP